MTAIYKREVRSYFHSMIGYVFIAFMIAFTGVYFMVYNLSYGYPYFSYVLSGVEFILLITIPVLTMKSFAEERKNKTDQLLLTSRASLFQVVLGKYLAMLSIMLIPCLLYLIFPLVIKLQGVAYITVDYLTILMFFLLGGVYISIGMFISALTESQIIAAIGTVGILFVLRLWDGLGDYIPTSAVSNAIGIALLLSLVVGWIYFMTRNWVISAGLEVVVVAACAALYFLNPSVLESALPGIWDKLELLHVFTNVFSNNLFDLSGIIMYLSVICVFVFLTMQVIQKRRWS